ncbi:hypothetical protein Tco_0086143 [Tanacetum coccineum]
MDKNVKKSSYKAKISIQYKRSDIDNKAVKSKVCWVIEGDENTKFFHGILTSKRSYLTICGTLVDGEWIVDPLAMKKLVVYRTDLDTLKRGSRSEIRQLKITWVSTERRGGPYEPSLWSIFSSANKKVSAKAPRLCAHAMCLVQLCGSFGFLRGSRLHFGWTSLCIGDSLTIALSGLYANKDSEVLWYFWRALLNLAIVTCSLAQSDLVKFVKKYGIALCYDPQLSSFEQTALDAPYGYISLYLSLFMIVNLCFTLNAFCLDVFEFFDYHFPLLDPFGVSPVTTFVVFYKDYRGEPTVPFFSSFLLLVLLVSGLPSRKGLVLETLISDAHPALITDFCLGLGSGTFSYPYLIEPFDEKPCQTPTLSVRPANQSIDVDSSFMDRLKTVDDNDQGESSFILKNQDVSGFELTVVGDGSSKHGVSVAEGFKKKLSITAALEEGATVIKLVVVGSSSKYEPKKRKQEVPKRTSATGSVPPPPAIAPKGVRKHLRVLARHMGSLEGGSDSLVPDVQEAYSSHNMLSDLHYLLIKNKLKSLSVDDLANVVKDLISKNAWIFKELSMLREKATSTMDSRKKLSGELDELRPSMKEVERLGQRCLDLEAERDFLLSKESEEIAALSSKLKIADLKRVELKAITYGRLQALDNVHSLGDSWDFKDVEDYHLDDEKNFDEVVEAFYKLAFPYISLLVKKAAQSLGELVVVDPPTIQEVVSL